MSFKAVAFSIIFLALFPSIIFCDTILPPPDAPLLEAVREGNLKKVKAILKEISLGSHKDRVNEKGRTGETSLSIAAAKGNLKIVKLLIANGAAVDKGKESGNRTALIEASGQGHVAIVRYLIAKGADVNVKSQGITALLAASNLGTTTYGPPGDKAETIRVLLENGADVNVQDESWMETKRTPLMYAVMQGNASLVKEILSKGAKLDFFDKNGDTALAIAKKEGLDYIVQILEKAFKNKNEASSLSVNAMLPLFKAIKEKKLNKVRLLLSKGADVNLRTDKGSTPLMYAADANAMDILKYLIKHGADVNAKNGTNETALIFASLKGHIDIVNKLLKNGADFNIKNISKGDALIYAVLKNQTKVVQSLLKHGANSNDRYDDGQTALMIASSQGSSDIAKLLIDSKTDINAVDKNGITALMIACEKGDVIIVERLLKARADINVKANDESTALTKAIYGKRLSIFKALIKQSKNYDTKEALFAAVGSGNLDMVKLLMKRDPDPNIKDVSGNTLLMYSLSGDIELMRFLLDRGADSNIKDAEGKTALMKVVESYSKNKVASAKLLLEKGADVNAVNDKEETALIIASNNWDADIVKLLVEKRSSINHKDNSGRTAWSYAFQGEQKTAILDILQKHGAQKEYYGLKWFGNVSNQNTEFIKAIETKEEWLELWRRAFDKQAPEIDFEKYVAASVFLGHSADWLYSISFGKPAVQDNSLVIPYYLVDIQLRLSGPFKAGGQYLIEIFKKDKDLRMVIKGSDKPRKMRQL
ncbi:MAG: ankyrin repeat domain-containing protein [Nitrospirae bacterium]|nr:ankyrin repeat domain-containing protein [Nitrospirota bacterium]